MDVYFLYRGQSFVWDGLKAIENRAKHGITFEGACEAFFDPFVEYLDASVHEESRIALLGLNGQRKLLYVVHVERDVSGVRIISARQATSQERDIYEDGS
jgi:uncharacterized DUF497 family protein